MYLKEGISFWQEVPVGLQASRFCYDNRETAGCLLAIQDQQHTKKVQHPVRVEDRHQTGCPACVAAQALLRAQQT